MASYQTRWRGEPGECSTPGRAERLEVGHALSGGPEKIVGIPSQQLFCGEREIVIEHDGQSYRLSITRQNKLILTK